MKIKKHTSLKSWVKEEIEKKIRKYLVRIKMNIHYTKIYGTCQKHCSKFRPITGTLKNKIDIKSKT